MGVLCLLCSYLTRLYLGQDCAQNEVLKFGNALEFPRWPEGSAKCTSIPLPQPCTKRFGLINRPNHQENAGKTGLSKEFCLLCAITNPLQNIYKKAPFILVNPSSVPQRREHLSFNSGVAFLTTCEAVLGNLIVRNNRASVCLPHVGRAEI